MLVPDSNGGMFIELGCFRKESKKIFARMIFIISHFSAYGPEIDMYIEKIHVHGNLDALASEMLGLEYFFNHNDFPVGYAGHNILPRNLLTLRNPEEEEYEAHDEHQSGTQRIGNEREWNKTQKEEGKGPSCNPYKEYDLITVFVNCHFFNVLSRKVIDFLSIGKL